MSQTIPRSAILALTLLLSCTRSTPHTDATRRTSADSASASPPAERPAGVDSLEKALTAFNNVFTRVVEVIAQRPGSEARRLASDSVLMALAQVDTMVAPAPGVTADSHIMVARHEIREAITALRSFLAGGADTVTGSRGRNALNMVEEHLKSARLALDQVGGYQ